MTEATEHRTMTGAAVCSLRRALGMTVEDFGVKVMGSKGSPATARKWVYKVERMDSLGPDLDTKIRKGVLGELRRLGYVTKIKFVLDRYAGPGSAQRIATAVDLHVSIVRAVLGFIRAEDRHGGPRPANGADVGRRPGHPRHRPRVVRAGK